jgi:SAM-dependent methyltransferase
VVGDPRRAEKLMMTKNDELIQIWLEDGYAIRDGYQENIQEAGVDSSKSIGERTDARDLSFFEGLTNGLRFNGSVSVLDIGCGKGEFISFFLERYPHTRLEPYVGIDIVPEFLALAQRRYPAFAFKQENFLRPDFDRGETFELVIALGVLVTRVRCYEEYLEYFINKMVRFSSNYVAFNIVTDVLPDSPNYENADKVGYTTSISIDKLENILSRIRNIDYKINSQNIFFDATDSFVQIKKR